MSQINNNGVEFGEWSSSASMHDIQLEEYYIGDLAILKEIN